MRDSDFELRFWPQPQIPQHIREQFRSLNFRKVKNGDPSPMRIALKKYKRRWDSYAIALVEPRPFERVIAWALITPGRTYGCMRASFYVRKNYRKLKLGKLLLREVLAFAAVHNVKMAFWRHDPRSHRFFKKYASGHYDVCDVAVCRYRYRDNRWQSPWRHDLRTSPKSRRKVKRR